jgi:hypothetical protein
MMMDKLHAWFEGCGRDKNEILNRLTADAVRQHRNKRLGDNSDAGGGEHNHGSLGGGLQGVLASHNASMVRLFPFFSILLSVSFFETSLPQRGSDLSSSNPSLIFFEGYGGFGEIEMYTHQFGYYIINQSSICLMMLDSDLKDTLDFYDGAYRDGS